jgi:hypothetical protein
MMTGSSEPMVAGIRGWLLAFVLWMGIINPVFWIGFTLIILNRMEAANPGDAELMREAGWDVLMWVVTIFREAIRVAAALMLYFYRKPVSVWIALVALWLAGPLLILTTWVVMEGSEFNIAGLVRSALWAVGWSLFLLMSERVRLTYGFRCPR